jgi:trehalose 6-phosphate phosphatase
VLDRIRELASRAGILLDFDGSLAAIVDHPDDARPFEGAREAILGLIGRYAVVAVVTGRRSEEVIERLAVDGLRYEGLYGMQEAAPELTFALLPSVEAAAAAVPESWVEDKQVSIAVHYRGAPDPSAARTALVARLEPVAAGSGFDVVEGKMVIELVPRDHPMKGGVVERIAEELELRGVLFAGDDVADLDAFAALDRLAGTGVTTVKVAVRGPETPASLEAAADVVVDGPAGLVALLGSL